jgi:hypothetical protein
VGLIALTGCMENPAQPLQGLSCVFALAGSVLVFLTTTVTTGLFFWRRTEQRQPYARVGGLLLIVSAGLALVAFLWPVIARVARSIGG